MNNEIEIVKRVLDSTPRANFQGRNCAANHLNVIWAIDPAWTVNALRVLKISGAVPNGKKDDREPECLYEISGRGIALFQLTGQMMKGDSKYGGVNTLRLRHALATASRDPQVRGGIMVVDSPGGTAAGTDELAMSIVQFAETKPIWTFIDDLAASAAMWASSASDKIFINRSGMAGSIGCYAVLYDTSGSAEIQGIKVIQLTTGPYKGAGEDGVEITEEQVKYFQTIVDGSAELFYRAIAEGRGIALSKVRDKEGIASGKVWNAQESIELGLVDEISTLNDVHEKLANSLDRKARAAAAGRITKVATQNRG